MDLKMVVVTLVKMIGKFKKSFLFFLHPNQEDTENRENPGVLVINEPRTAGCFELDDLRAGFQKNDGKIAAVF